MWQIKAVGTDTEVFLKDKEGNDVPACGLIGGTKQDPRPLNNDGAMVQEDNVMLEFNTKPALTNTEWLVNINTAMVLFTEELRQRNLVVNISPSVRFKAEQLLSPQAKVMGCEPDWDAWDLKMNDLLSPEMLGDVRTAGGHIHVSFAVDGQNPTPEQMVNLIRMLDLTLGVPSVLLDEDDRRRLFYGRAGAHRVKADDRVEYRTLSNFWIRNDTLKNWAFEGVVDAIRRLNGLGNLAKTTLVNETLRGNILAAVRDSNKDAAKRLIAAQHIRMP